MEGNGGQARRATPTVNHLVEGGEKEGPCAAGFTVRPEHAVLDPRQHVFPYVYPSFGDAMYPNASHQSDAVGDVSDAQKAAHKSLAPRRTLKMLTAQFLGEYGRQEGTKIHVDSAADRLNTVRRRMYDIMAVCMEIGLVSKSGKAQYIWQGEAAARKAVDKIIDNSLKTQSVLFKDGKKPQSLRGLTRGMIAFLSQTQSGSFIEVDHVAMNVLNIDACGSTVKHKLRRAYDVVSVLSALKMVVEAPAQAQIGVKPKRCLSWKGVEGILPAIEEAEKIDFGSNSFSGYDAGNPSPAPNNNMSFVLPGMSALQTPTGMPMGIDMSSIQHPYLHMPPAFFQLAGSPLPAANNNTGNGKGTSNMYQHIFPSPAYTTIGPFAPLLTQRDAGLGSFNAGSSAIDQQHLMQYVAACGAQAPHNDTLLLPTLNNGTIE